MLPTGLPTSFEGEFGYIRYTARVVLDIPLWPDTTFINPFTVIKAMDLNADASLRVQFILFLFLFPLYFPIISYENLHFFFKLIIETGHF